MTVAEGIGVANDVTTGVGCRSFVTMKKSLQRAFWKASRRTFGICAVYFGCRLSGRGTNDGLRVCQKRTNRTPKCTLACEDQEN